MAKRKKKNNIPEIIPIRSKKGTLFEKVVNMYYSWGHPDQPEIPKSQTRTSVENMFDHPDGYLFALTLRGQIIGCYIGTTIGALLERGAVPSNEDFWKVVERFGNDVVNNTFYGAFIRVSDGHQGSGYGSRLMERSVQIARAQERSHFAFTTNNPRALETYGRLLREPIFTKPSDFDRTFYLHEL